jgi:hypothetical protein
MGLSETEQAANSLEWVHSVIYWLFPPPVPFTAHGYLRVETSRRGKRKNGMALCCTADAQSVLMPILR